jgi:hypothetical protein
MVQSPNFTIVCSEKHLPNAAKSEAEWDVGEVD